MRKRAAGKKLIGFQASEELRGAIDDWLKVHPGRSVTDFLLSACIDKLKTEGIDFNLDQALVDGRFRRPPSQYPSVNDPTYVLNKKGVTVSAYSESEKKTKKFVNDAASNFFKKITKPKL